MQSSITSKYILTHVHKYLAAVRNTKQFVIDHFSRSHGMLIEKLIAYDISTGVLWRLEYFPYADHFLPHYTIILLEITCI